jgi:cell wall-associated NlpC family hydrolase
MPSDRPSFVVLMMVVIALGACASERNADRGPASPALPAQPPAPSISRTDGEDGPALSHAQTITVVPASEELMSRAAAGGTAIRTILRAAKPTIGTPYKWGGTDMAKGIDCSNYTWLLYRSIGVSYERYIRTQALATMRSDAAFSQTTFADAQPGDLLVYGYRDGSGAWHGHVVILVDKSGHDTGSKGLVLGAQGSPVSAVQFVTFDGFEQGYFKIPEMRLLNVLRPIIAADAH